MPSIIINSVHLDAGESSFFAGQLQQVMPKIYEKRYPELKATQLIPVSTELSPGAESYVYRQFDAVGVAKFIANYADDAPMVDIAGVEIAARIKGISDAYGYSVQDIRAAAMAGLNLESRKAASARKAIEYKLDTVAWFGDAARGIPGLLTNPNITGSVAADDASTSSTLWSAKTSDEILTDVTGLINSVPILTNGVENVNVVLMPISQFALISTTKVSSYSDKTILEWLKSAHPNVTFESLALLASAEILSRNNSVPLVDGTGNSSSVMIAYRKDEEVLAMQIPMMFTQHAPLQQNLMFKIICEARTGGTPVYLPLACAILEGI